MKDRKSCVLCSMNLTWGMLFKDNQLTINRLQEMSRKLLLNRVGGNYCDNLGVISKKCQRYYCYLLHPFTVKLADLLNEVLSFSFALCLFCCLLTNVSQSRRSESFLWLSARAPSRAQ